MSIWSHSKEWQYLNVSLRVCNVDAKNDDSKQEDPTTQPRETLLERTPLETPWYDATVSLRSAVLMVAVGHVASDDVHASLHQLHQDLVERMGAMDSHGQPWTTCTERLRIPGFGSNGANDVCLLLLRCGTSGGFSWGGVSCKSPTWQVFGGLKWDQ